VIRTPIRTQSLDLDRSGAGLVVEMTCPWGVAKARLTERNADDVADRLRIFDQTPPLPEADLQTDTVKNRPTQAANRILERAQACPPPEPAATRSTPRSARRRPGSKRAPARVWRCAFGVGVICTVCYS
jgi:hypothetical protein